jgi:PTS system nitrogen regulatory IIA component
VQLTTLEVSQLLNVPEATVAKWIRQRGLPAHLVQGRHRFNRAELLEWATANRVNVSADLFEPADGGREATPSLVEALKAGGIVYGVPGGSKERAFRSLVQALPLPDGVDRNTLLRLFLAREINASTAIGDGIAVPHVRTPIVLPTPQPLVTLCFLDTPVDFGARDGVPVRVLFSLVCPTVRGHLRLLARLVSALHDPAFKAAVLRAAPADELLREAARVESGAPFPAAAAAVEGGAL